jgi:hypothetical protein
LLAPAHPKLTQPRIPSIKSPHLQDRLVTAQPEEMDHVSTPIAPFYWSQRFSCVCGQPFRHRARCSRRRGHSVRPTAFSYREAPPGQFTARAALIGSRRELHPIPDRLGRGNAVGLLPGVTAGFLTRRHENQPMKPNPSPTCAYGPCAQCVCPEPRPGGGFLPSGEPWDLGPISGHRAPAPCEGRRRRAPRARLKPLSNSHSTRVFQLERVGRLVREEIVW